MHMPLVLTNRRRRGGSASAPAFSPSTLFSSTAVGIWLDPSDLSTMFSDRAGTTPVTAPGTVVGLRLDKSKGPPGPQLLTNGTFDDGLTGWTAFSCTLSVSGGVLSVISTGAAGGARATIATVAGKQYQIFGTSIQVTSRGIISVGSTAGGNELLSFSPLTGTSTVGGFFIATGTTTHISLNLRDTTSGFEVKYDNISVRELAGNHAVAPTDAARPIYGVEPKGGRRNLLTWSEDFRSTAQAGETRPWTVDNSGATNPVVTANFATAPDGTTTADRIQMNKTGGTYTRVQQVMTLPSNVYAFSVWLRNNVSGTVNVALRVGGTFANRSVTGDWQRFSVFLDAASSTADAQIMLHDAFGSDETADILAWGAQLELGSTATNYQRVTNDYDVTEAGVQTCHYCRYDGSNSSMSTAAIDFTGTDKMSVFAGVRKLSDVVVSASDAAVIAEFGNAVGNGFVSLSGSTGFSTNQKYSFFSKGTVISNALTTSSTYSAPVSNVLTGLGDISGDRATLRINGTQVAQSTTDQGTGNYLANPLYIGRRTGTQYPFNGRDYGLIVVGKAASAGEISDTETWLAAKTSGVTL